METRKEVDVLFVIPPYHKRNGSGSLFPLGIGAIMAYIEQKGITYDYIDCPRIIDSLYLEDLQKLKTELNILLRQYDPILVGIGPCVTPGVRGLEIVARSCLDAFGDENVFAGGPFTSLPSQEWFFYEHLGLTYLIKGEGEEAVYDAISTLKCGKSLKQCKSVSYAGYSKMNIIQNLDEMPFPKRVEMEKNIFSERRKHVNNGVATAHIVASRSCPYHCSYCVSGNLQIPFRKRSAENIVSEMKMLKEQYGISDIVFYDDCFFTGPNTIHQEIDKFCAALDKADLHMTWQIEMRPDVLVNLSDEELRKLFRFGCRQMNIGVEKTYDNGAYVFGKTFDYLRLKTYIAHAHLITEIRMTGTFILGGKDETKETVKKMIKDSVEINLDEAEYSPLFVYPDTPIYNDVFSNPRSWLDVLLSSAEPWGEIVYENDDLTKEDLIALVDEAYKCFNKERQMTNKIRDRYNLKGICGEANDRSNI